MRTVQSIILFLILCVYSQAQQTEQMFLSGKDIDENVLWDFYCTEGRKANQWSKIRVPSCWELEGFGTYNYGHDNNKGKEKGLYKTEFSLPDTWKNKRLYIVFEGAMTDTKVVVNKKNAGEVHQGGFYQFEREITDLVRFGKSNLLEVEVSKVSANKSINAAERDADFWLFGGIFRPVYIKAVPKSFIDHVSIDARQNGTVCADVSVEGISGRLNILLDVFTLDTNRKVGTFSSEIKGNGAGKVSISGNVPAVLPWSAENPVLYKAVVSISNQKKLLHTVEEKIGFRTIEVKSKDGVYINGKKIMFKGVNRHCFWPETGRTVPDWVNLKDARLIKDMNMNAVRMSHYPPDKRFLEICDSLGLYVIDELCAWQYPPYDTQVGTVLVQEMLRRDTNHPSVIFWSNGNEGGFNYELDCVFTQLDNQKRPVLHPWGLSSDINTVHYINYNSGIKNMFNGRDIFMPTELLHGLYDGGHGTGLDDFWNAMLINPLSAGLFLWDFADQGVIRTDKGNVLDTDKDHGADGIVGPYREKEGSYYTVKEIWSPIYMEKRYITPSWDGVLNIENRYDFTNADQCRFSYKMVRFNSLFPVSRDTIEGCVKAPDLAPGEKGRLKLELPDNWLDYDMLYVTATDKYSQELFTWSFELQSPDALSTRMLKEDMLKKDKIEVDSYGTDYRIKSSGVVFRIDKNTGLLGGVQIDEQVYPLTDGPMLITDNKMKCREVVLRKNEDKVTVQVKYDFVNDKRAYEFLWTVYPSGLLQLDYSYRPNEFMQMAGITFNFPEKGIEGASILAKGPYRVYNNRIKGGRLDVWDKTYNNTITGESWNYPEFKGYYALFYGMKLNCKTPFEIYCATEDVTLHLFTPENQQHYALSKNYTTAAYPKGNISFMDAIPSVGTKMGKAEYYGPQSQKHSFKSYSGLGNLKGKVYFKFK